MNKKNNNFFLFFINKKILFALFKYYIYIYKYDI